MSNRIIEMGKSETEVSYTQPHSSLSYMSNVLFSYIKCFCGNVKNTLFKMCTHTHKHTYL